MFKIVSPTGPVATFSFSTAQQLRVITVDGEPWFVAADVCNALNLENVTKALLRLDGDERALISIQGISRGNDQVNIINESGLYSLILGSRKPEAKRFKKWVTSEVLPSIRKTGTYSVRPIPPRQETRQLQGPVVSVLQYGEQGIRIVHREDGIWVSARDAVPAMGYRGGVTLITQRLPRGEAQTIDVGPHASVARKLIVLNGAGISRLANRGTKPTARAFADWLSDALASGGMEMAAGPVTTQRLPLRRASALPTKLTAARPSMTERFQIDQKAKMRAEAQTAKVMLREIEASNRRSNEVTGDYDVLAAAAILKSAILNTQNLHGLAMGLADYLCMALEGSQPDLDEWEVLDEIHIPRDRKQAPSIEALF